MNIERFTVESAYDGLPLACVTFEPDARPRGVFQIVHGMCERKERYEAFMHYLAENGFVAAAHDHRGHGASVLSDADLGWFRDRKGSALVEDAVPGDRRSESALSRPARAAVRAQHGFHGRAVLYPGTRRGHRFPRGVRFAQQKFPAGAGVALAKSIAAVKGERHRSPLLARVSTGGGRQAFSRRGKKFLADAGPRGCRRL